MACRIVQQSVFVRAMLPRGLSTERRSSAAMRVYKRAWGGCPVSNPSHSLMERWVRSAGHFNIHGRSPGKLHYEVHFIFSYNPFCARDDAFVNMPRRIAGSDEKKRDIAKLAE